jgi:hypothetical protein
VNGRFLTSCVGVEPDKVHLLNKMIENGKQITRRTFLKHVDRFELRVVERELGYEDHPRRGLTMAGDWHVAYFKGHWDGRPCIYFVWSAIEYIFVSGS